LGGSGVLSELRFLERLSRLIRGTELISTPNQH
jgi:hypothetical protein